MSWVEDYNKSGRDEVGRSFVYGALGLLGIVMGSVYLQQSCSNKREGNLLEKTIKYDCEKIEKQEMQDSLNYKGFDNTDYFYRKE